MSSRLRIKPFGLSENGNHIDDFDSSEMDVILSLFKSLGKKCKDSFNNMKKVSVKPDPDQEGIILIKYVLGNVDDLSDDDFLFYIESLTGHNSDNIVEIGGEDYSIMGEPVEDPPEPECKNFLEKMEKMEKMTKSRKTKH